ncbi:MAG: type II secretion system F family protein [Lachnospiraceae bacterium]|nr:type II secretion system F family protein [Lachnospiraceae bacterium]
MANMRNIVRRWKRSERKISNKRERIRLFFVGEGLLILLNLLCYRDGFWMIPEQILLIPGWKIWEKRKMKKERRQYETGFRDLLRSLMTSFQAGYSLENACRIALKEMESSGEKPENPIVGKLRKLVQGLELHIPADKMFAVFARETGLEEAGQLSAVIEIVHSTGGNMVDVLKRSMEHMKARMDAREEIQVLLSGKIFEKNIMLLMPLCIFLYLRITNPEYVACFYQSVTGHLMMSAVIGIILFCFYWTEKIMDIQF